MRHSINWFFVALLLPAGCALDDAGQSKGLGAEAEAPPSEPQLCSPLSVSMTQAAFAAGSLRVSNDATDVIVTLDAATGCLLDTVDLYIGVGDAPRTRLGALDRARFPFRRVLEGGATRFELRVPYAEIGADCGEHLGVAASASVRLIATGQSLVAWAQSDLGLDAQLLDYGMCCIAPELPEVEAPALPDAPEAPATPDVDVDVDDGDCGDGCDEGTDVDVDVDVDAGVSTDDASCAS